MSSHKDDVYDSLKTSGLNISVICRVSFALKHVFSVVIISELELIFQKDFFALDNFAWLAIFRFVLETEQNIQVDKMANTSVCLAC